MTNEKINTAQIAIFEATKEAFAERRNDIVLQLSTAYEMLTPVRDSLPDGAERGEVRGLA